MWVRSRYANELAVLAAWLSLLIPWNVAQHSHEVPGTGETSILFFRFPLVEFQFRENAITQQVGGGGAINIDVSQSLDMTFAGSKFWGDLYVAFPHSAVQFYEGTLWQASLLWAGAALLLVVAFLLSIALYFREDWVESHLSVLPVHVMGALLTLGALGTAGASVLYYLERDVVGFPIPVGVLVLGLLGVVLLLTQPVSDDDSTGPDDDAIGEQH